MLILNTTIERRTTAKSRPCSFEYFFISGTRLLKDPQQPQMTIARDSEAKNWSRAREIYVEIPSLPLIRW